MSLWDAVSDRDYYDQGRQPANAVCDHCRTEYRCDEDDTDRLCDRCLLGLDCADSIKDEYARFTFDELFDRR